MTEPRKLAPGENAPIPGGTVRLTVLPATVPLLLVQLTAEDTVHGSPVAGWHTGVQRFVADHRSLSLAALDPQVQRCLLVAHQLIPSTSVELATQSETLSFATLSPGSHPAAVLVEFYRRGGGWKVRALGHSYAGGLPELGRLHGAELSDPAPDDYQSVEPQQVDGVDTVADFQRIFRHLNGIWEDAARSTLSFGEAVQFAEARRDQELSELVAEAAGRSAEHPARLASEQKYQQVVQAASARRLTDLDVLIAELAEFEKTLPASAAAWDAASWSRPIGHQGSGLIRIGEVTRPDNRSLRIPVLQSIALPGGLWLDTPGALIEQPTLGLLERIFAAAPAGRRAEVISADDQLAGLLGLAAQPGAGGRAEQLGALALQLDLSEMAATNGLHQQAADHAGALPSVLVVPAQSIGISAGESAALEKLAIAGPQFGLSVVFVSDSEQLAELRLRVEPRDIPTVPALAKDPWMGQLWDFQPDSGGDPQIAVRLRSRMRRPG